MTILYRDDCINILDSISPESVDLIIADPPYFRVVQESWDMSWKEVNEYLEWCKTWITKCSNVLRKGGTIYVFWVF